MWPCFSGQTDVAFYKMAIFVVATSFLLVTDGLACCRIVVVTKLLSRAQLWTYLHIFVSKLFYYCTIVLRCFGLGQIFNLIHCKRIMGEKWCVLYVQSMKGDTVPKIIRSFVLKTEPLTAREDSTICTSTQAFYAFAYCKPSSGTRLLQLHQYSSVKS